MWPFKRKSASELARKPVRGRNLYSAAGTGRLTADWGHSLVHPDDLIRFDFDTLRKRSRHQYANNDYMARFVSLVKSNVIGPKGIRLQATKTNADGTLDELDNNAIERAFEDWGRPGNCEVTGQHSFVDVQRLMISSLIVDGEFLVVEHQSGDYGYTLQLVDPAHLESRMNDVKLSAGRVIRFGIEFDSFGKPLAYYFRDDAATSDSYDWGGRRYRRVPAKRVIHGFLPERIGQKRGLPAASTAMMRMQMLSGYEDAAITAARVGAAKMGFFTSPSGDGYVGDGEEDGATITDVEPGIFEQLPEGMGFEPFNPDYPHQQYGEFVKSCLRGISSGLGVSYNSLANDLEGVNYSSIRAGVLEDREAWKAMQEWFINAFMRRVYLNWLPEALLRGQIVNAADVTLPMSRLDRFQSHSWKPRRWDWVDPLKDTQANIQAIQNGLKSRRQIIVESGADPEEVWSQLEAENARLSSLLSQPQEAPNVGDSEEVSE